MWGGGKGNHEREDDKRMHNCSLSSSFFCSESTRVFFARECTDEKCPSFPTKGILIDMNNPFFISLGVDLCVWRSWVCVCLSVHASKGEEGGEWAETVREDRVEARVSSNHVRLRLRLLCA